MDTHTHRQTGRAIDRITIGRDAGLTYRVLEGIRIREENKRARREAFRVLRSKLQFWKGGAA
jgi:hypothetical protein